MFRIAKDQYDLPDYSQVMDGYGKLFEDIKAGRIISAYAVEGNGLAEAVSKMAFGNKLGVKIEHNVDPKGFLCRRHGATSCARCRTEWWDELSIILYRYRRGDGQRRI